MQDTSVFRSRKRSRLPHWDVPDGTYFVTYCLHDALPRAFIERLRQRREDLERAIEKGVAGPTVMDRWQGERALVMEAEKHLDRSDGICWLRQPAPAEIAANALRFFDRERYDLLAWVVMPNHVHAVARLFSGITIDRVIHSWKSYTAKECNRLVGRGGRFWQEDYFDRSIRDREHLERAMTYVGRNPIKAGLADWPWVQVNWDRVDAGEAIHVVD
jgi:REP element-mobilizing transposase RayT